MVFLSLIVDAEEKLAELKNCRAQIDITVCTWHISVLSNEMFNNKLGILLRRIYFECFIISCETLIYAVFMHLCKSVCDELYDVTVVLLRQDR